MAMLKMKERATMTLMSVMTPPMCPPSPSKQGDNELLMLELIHRYVEVLDKYFGSVCELDIIFNFEKAYFILDELILAGEVQETSKKAVQKQIEFADNYQEEEIISLALKDVGLI